MFAAGMSSNRAMRRKASKVIEHIYGERPRPKRRRKKRK